MSLTCTVITQVTHIVVCASLSFPVVSKWWNTCI